MALVFDIETVGQAVDSLPPRVIDYLFERLEKNRYGGPEADIGDEERSRRREEAIDRFSLDPTTGSVVCIGLIETDSGREETLVVDASHTEHDVLTRFWDAVREPPARWVSFNGKRFDVPYLKLRSAILGVAPSVVIEETRGTTSPHFDVYEVLAGFDTRRKGNLDYFSAIFGLDSPKTLMDGSLVGAAYRAGRIDEIAAYCLADCRATAALFERLRPFYG